MDPDTTRKLGELLNLMEDISSDVDTKSGLVSLAERIASLESRVEELAERFDRLERTYQEKYRRIKTLSRDLQDLLPDR